MIMASAGIIRSLLVVAASFSFVGCFGKSLASPFDVMQNAPITVLRLQNYEPPTQSQPQAGPVQLPPQIQQWLTAGAQLLPPGLLPPNLIPGAAATTAAPNVARFHGFPILATAQVMDNKNRGEILDILGHESNFVNQPSTCMYAEFGIAIAQQNAPAAEILVSLSCGQVQPFQMAWPYSKVGITPDTEKRIVAVMQKAFGG